MPIKTANIIYTGTDGGLCAYISRGRVVYRYSNPLESERVKTDPAFKGFRESSSRLKRAAPIAAALYNQIPKEKKVYSLYRVLTGEAIKMIRQGVDEIAIQQKLQQLYIDPVVQQPIKQTDPVTERKREGHSAFSGRRLFTTYPSSVTIKVRRSCRHKRVLQYGNGMVVNQPVQKTDNSPLTKPEHVPVAQSKRPPNPPQPTGLIYIGRCKDFKKLKMWLLPPDQLLNIKMSYKTRKYISLWDGKTKIAIRPLK